jgi:hypothetical protein
MILNFWPPLRSLNKVTLYISGCDFIFFFLRQGHFLKKHHRFFCCYFYVHQLYFLKIMIKMVNNKLQILMKNFPKYLQSIICINSCQCKILLGPCFVIYLLVVFGPKESEARQCPLYWLSHCQDVFGVGIQLLNPAGG